MASTPITDNLDLTAAKPLDDREGLYELGVWRSYTSINEANTKIDIRKYVGMEVPISLEVSTGVFVDAIHRWNGTEWILSDAIQLSSDAIYAFNPVFSDNLSDS